MKNIFLIFILIVSMVWLEVSSQPSSMIDFSKAEKGEAFSAGEGSSLKMHDSKAFKHPLSNLPQANLIDFSVGFAFFKKLWVSSPSTTTASDGLGPLYNARSCIACHIGLGRGHPPLAASSDKGVLGYPSVSMMLRLSIPPQTKAEYALLKSHKVNSFPDPVYGGQLQGVAVRGLSAEGQINIDYKERVIELVGGEKITLRVPRYSIIDKGYGKLHTELMMSPRVAPSLIGMGLLSAISEQDIQLRSDPDDVNKDGISGRVNQVWSVEYKRIMLGRYGYKAGMPTLNAQNQDAFHNDLGLSTALGQEPWGDCTTQQTLCRRAPHGNDPQFDFLEVPTLATDAVLFFVENIAVPKRHYANDSQVLAGKHLFHKIGCISCHQPQYKTQKIIGKPALSEQIIWPYTDLLLHDMGEELADHRPEGRATGREWRTAPLWGIGLTQTVNKKAMFLHDGRAKTVQEAILWHGGEAQVARDRFITLSKIERKQLLIFLGAL
ncbi:MAG: thiol oxidoreductase [Cocleimonas sp.]|nr:thiol oxidoreductase [Cocleimonas sp.]